MNKILLILLSSFLLVSCGSSDNPPPNTVATLDGTYNVAVISTTQFDNFGGACANASGALQISGSNITGSVVGPSGVPLTLSGTVDTNGQITGGFAVNSSGVATYTGSVSGNSGSGTWTDIYGCSGTWSITRL